MDRETSYYIDSTLGMAIPDDLPPHQSSDLWEGEGNMTSPPCLNGSIDANNHPGSLLSYWGDHSHNHNFLHSISNRRPTEEVENLSPTTQAGGSPQCHTNQEFP